MQFFWVGNRPRRDTHKVLVRDIIYEEDSVWDFSSPGEQIEDMFGSHYVKRFTASGGSFWMAYTRDTDAQMVALKIWASHPSQRWLTVFGLL